jgi:hypothetical protein
MRRKLVCVALVGLLLVTLTVSSAGSVFAAPAAAIPALPQTQVTIDGVTLTVESPVLPARQFSAPLPDQSSQQAIMTAISPYREVSIMAVPLGTTSEFDGIAATASGGAPAYRQALVTVRASQKANWLRAPTASIFGQQTSGSGAVVDLPLHGTRNEPAVVVEWVAEAGSRVWTVRIVVGLAFAQAQPGGVQGFVDTLAQVRLTSASLAAPSTLLRALSTHRASTSPTKATSSPSATQQPPALAPATALPFPSWWNGNCDANAHGSPTSYPLGDSYQGLPACGPRPAFDNCGNYCDYPEHFYSGAWGELEWECVELSMRYLYLAYAVNPYSANGNQVVANYSGSALTKVTNGSGQAPVPGDVISFNDANAAGHTALVASSSVSNGNGTIYVLQQNFGGNGYGNSNDLMPMTVSGGVLQDLNGLHALGWLHAGARIGYIDGSGNFYAQQGSLSTNWSLETQGVIAFAMAGDRIGILQASGDFSVKEGGLNAPWTNLTSYVTAIALTTDPTYGDRIGWVDTSGNYYVKEGPLTAPPQLEIAGGVAAIALSGTRIAALDNTGAVRVKEGSLGAQWTTQIASGATAIALSGTRIGVLGQHGIVYGKDGGLNAQWTTVVTNGAVTIGLQTT